MTNRSLWQHQQDSWTQARKMYADGFRSILVQNPTGTGKTRMVAHGVNTAISREAPGQDHIPTSKRRNQIAWIVVPRRELLWQTSDELKQWGINHQIISGQTKEKAGFQTYVWSLDTLYNRIKADNIRYLPELVIPDEAHNAIDKWLKIKAALPDTTIIIGVTATPERLDGRPLLGMYDVMVPGQQLSWFVDGEYLKRPKLYGIPQDLRIMPDVTEYTRTGEMNKKSNAELDRLRRERSRGGFLYGDIIEHYNDLSRGMPFLHFCRSIIEAEAVADEWNRKGFKVASIDGGMTDKKRRDLIDSIRTGSLIGLTAVDLPTYGLDVPNISCIIFGRKTMSVALVFQMLGRGLRYDPGQPFAHIHDHVGNFDPQPQGGHGHPLEPRVWNFEGHERKKTPRDAVEHIAAVDKCPVCWDLIINGVCRSCGATKEVKPRHDLKQVDGWLVEIKEPTAMNDRPPESRRHYQDMINTNVDRYRTAWTRGEIDSTAVAGLLTAAHDLKRRPMWVYHLLEDSDGPKPVNVSLLSEIARQKDYKPYWGVMKREELENRTRTRTS